MNVYQVEKILKRKIIQGKAKYLTKWKGYSDEHNSWEPKESFFNTELIDFFEKKSLEKRIKKKKIKMEENKIEKNEIKEIVLGKFESDFPIELTDAKIYRNNDIACKVIWKCRKDNIKPDPTYYHINIIRDKCPQLLIDLFLKQINVIDPEKIVDIPDYVIKEDNNN